ncbi:hypothetical protein [Pseudomonas sp. MWU16-30317]|uniref:hypothetical protein n=1 Tax=Pseudomonas sp. MWU16-30317 TaxID=2878095 RepID=UPI001CFBE575|nr:hypothetical protein [Pseudomonas sp. MWU16-30317]
MNVTDKNNWRWAGLVYLLFSVIAQADSGLPRNTGSIILNGTCSIPITEKSLRKVSSWEYGTFEPCDINTVNTIQLKDVRSAVTIKLRSYGVRERPISGLPRQPPNDCDETQSQYAFRIDIKTVGNITGTSKPFDIDDLLSASPASGEVRANSHGGRAVVENLRLVSKSQTLVPEYPIHEYLSCFHFDF